MTHSPLISGPVLCLCLRLDRGPPFCIVIYVELFSHRALRRRPVVNRRRYIREVVSESRVRGVAAFSLGGKSLHRMDGEIPHNGNIYKSSCAFIIPAFISKLEKNGDFIDCFPQLCGQSVNSTPSVFSTGPRCIGARGNKFSAVG